MKPADKTPSEPVKPTKIESPVRHYEKPQDVLKDSTLSDQSKRKALDNWEVDAQALQRADDEGMSGGESSKLLDVVDAKERLGVETKSRQSK